jgi:phosphotransferase system HPr (HPr) family protein
MKRSTVRVAWTHGLHLRPAARLMRLAQQFRANVWLQCGSRRADLRSMLSIISLCAMMGTALEVEAAGEDEETAIQAVERFFRSGDDDRLADVDDDRFG